MTDGERRRCPRHRLQVEGTLSGPEGPQSIVTVDISEGGVGFEGGQSVPPGSPVSIRITAGHGAGLTFRGVVTWCLQVVKGGLPRYRMGMETESIAGEGGSVTGKTARRQLLHRILARYAGG